MTSKERVFRAIKGEKVDRTPIYGWVSANLSNEITERFGSVEDFEDKYEFDAAHIFGGPKPYGNGEQIKELRESCDEFTPDILLEKGTFVPASEQDWTSVKNVLEHHKKRSRFCYIQTPGFLSSSMDCLA